jgi:hypothetical protein
VNIPGLRNRWLVGTVVVVIVALGVVVLRVTVGGDEPVRALVPTGEQGPGLVSYQDPQGRFGVSYPRSWSRLASADPQVALLASAGPESGGFAVGAGGVVVCAGEPGTVR